MLRIIGTAADVTERKRIEEALHESEERLRLAVQAGRMYAFEWNAATDEIVRTGECAEVFTWLADPSRDTGRQFLARVHPDDRESYSTLETAPTPENPTYQTNYRLMRPDGSVIWQEESGRAFFDEQGRMTREIGMVADATSRKLAEETLRQREIELLEAQRVAKVGSWQWNPESGEITWSEELYRIAGRDSDLPPPAFGEQTKLYTSESWEHLRNAVAEALRTGTPYKLDLEMVRPDGSTRWVIDRGEAVRDAEGRIAYLRGTAQDITERKRAENELRASEEKFRSVFRDAAAGMVIVSLEGRFLAANQAFCECLGYPEEELLQKTVQSITVEEDWPNFSRRLSEMLDRGKGFQGVEKHSKHRSGRIIATECNASLIRGPGGEPRYIVVQVLDVTQRKLAEEALSSVSRKLIEAHEEERARIARELHDDFNQRVALVAVNLERVRQDLPASRSELRSCIDEILKSVEELGTDIHRLSHRLHSSKLEYLGLVAASDSFCKEVSDRWNVEVNFHTENVPKTLPREISLCLFRVLQEAIQNAIKHSGVRRFDVSLIGTSNEVQLCVRDAGVGFDSEKVIIGLGLTSMKERLKLVEGQLSIDSKLQAGTIVEAHVPLSLGTKSAGAAGR
ncbi:MAG TPA: PAS domain S-box protein [Terriglobales bacterium]|nr:PAS domain S-box protein [Terriglobales bacterium]